MSLNAIAARDPLVARRCHLALHLVGERIGTATARDGRPLERIVDRTTKIAAFLDRGAASPLVSHDLDDIVRLVDSRPELVGELRAAAPILREWTWMRLCEILEDRMLLDAMRGERHETARKLDIDGRSDMDKEHLENAIAGHRSGSSSS